MYAPREHAPKAAPAVAPPQAAPRRTVWGPPVQRQALDGGAHDPHEREADATAERVVSAPRPPAAPAPAPRLMTAPAPAVQRQAAPAPTPAPAATRLPTAVGPRLAARLGSGQPLAPPLRGELEAGFGPGVDFAAVRVHTDAEAAWLTAQLDARAFAYGPHLFFGPGQFDPTSAGGRRLLAHELTHVLQQGHGRPPARPAHRATHLPAAALAAPAVQRAVLGLDPARRVDQWLSERPGWRLLTQLLGYNPVLAQAVARTPTGLVQGLLELLPGGGARFAQLEQTGTLVRAFAWVEAALLRHRLTKTRVLRLLAQARAALSLSDALNPLGALDQLAAPFVALLQDLGGLATEAAGKALELVFEGGLGPDGARVLAVLRRAGAAFRLMRRDPVGFLANLVATAKKGFTQFLGKAPHYLHQGLLGWLLAALARTPLRLPATLDPKGLLSLALQAVGATYPHLRAKLVRASSEATVAGLEHSFGFLQTLMRQGVGAAWALLQDSLGNVRAQVLDGVQAWVEKTVLTQAILRLVALFNPAGAVLQALQFTYTTVTFFLDKGRQIADVVETYLNALGPIAEGKIGAAANTVEGALGRSVPLVLTFLAGFLGLKQVPEVLQAQVQKARVPIDKALDRLVAWLLKQGGKVVAVTKDGGRQVVDTVRGWLGLRQQFTTPGGERHTLYFEGSEASTEVMVASRPQAVREFLNGLPAGGMQQQQWVVQAREVLSRLYQLPRQKPRPANLPSLLKHEFAILAPLLAQLTPSADFYPLGAIPPQRALPPGFDVRNDLYINGSQYNRVRVGIRQQGVAHIRQQLQLFQATKNINTYLKLQADEQVVKPAQYYLGLTNQQLLAEVKESDYDVDHLVPLAQDWVIGGGNNVNDNARQGLAGDVSKLRVILKSINRSKQANGYQYAHAFFVQPNFSSLYNNSLLGSRKIKNQSF